MSDWIDVAVSDGRFQAYRATAAGSAPAPVIVVIQEIFGVNEDIRATCDELAAKGYNAIAPDLFWRVAPRIDMNRLDEEDWKKGFALYQGFDFDRGVDDITATIAEARRLDGASGRVGIMGFCLGGLMAFLAAARTDVDAAASYYGGGTENYVEEARGIDRPLLLHLAGNDEYMPPDAQQKIQDVLGGNPHIEIDVYPGRDHAFARHKGLHYDAADASLAHERTIALFDRVLKA